MWYIHGQWYVEDNCGARVYGLGMVEKNGFSTHPYKPWDADEEEASLCVSNLRALYTTLLEKKFDL